MSDKSDNLQTGWVQNLKALMQTHGLNPRRLSLIAGLNATAVRDMIDGRVRSPRYDTIVSLAQSLGVTPAELMGDATPIAAPLPSASPKAETSHSLDCGLLSEIISKLQTASVTIQPPITPKDFAAITTAIYQTVQTSPKAAMIQQLLAYETLRRSLAG